MRSLSFSLCAFVTFLGYAAVNVHGVIPGPTWSGGQAGVSLNATELEIYSVQSDSGGYSAHFWLTGGNKSNVDNAIVTFYVDGVAAHTFQPNMAAGTGWVDDQTPCQLGNCPEKNSNWNAGSWIGKGSGMGGWYNDFKVPFTKSFRATIRSHASLLRTPHDQCEAVQDMDCWGNDLVQKYGVKSAGDCCNLCRNSSQCGAYTFHPDGTCFLKTRCGGMQPSKGNTTGSLNSWSVLEGVAFPGASAVATPQPAAAVSDCAAACDAAAVQATGHAQAPCKAFTYDAERKLCTLLNGTTGGQVPSSTFIASGCRGCEDTAGAGGFDDSVFVLVRGFYGKAGVDIRIGDVTVPSSARLVTQENNALLQPLDYYDLLSLNNATHGLVLMTTLSVLSGTANFMEGCFHFYTSGKTPEKDFPGEIMATGTEDYYNSGYYFINAYPQHLTSTGFTFNEAIQAPTGPFTTGLKWSVYRLHVADPLIFVENGVLRWRNGDVALPGIGKCRYQDKAAPVGQPTESYVRSLAYAYVWDE